MYYKLYHPTEFWYVKMKYTNDDAKLAKFKENAIKDNAVVFLPHVNYSADFSLRKVEGDVVIQEGLSAIKGVGEKVANCIMLFGLGVKDVFPVDTWINKVYNSLTKTQETDRKKITKELTMRYGNLSGYAQQYFFYYFRENKINV